MADTITYLPDQNQANNVLPWMLAGNNGFGGLGGNLGAGAIGFILGAIIGNNGWGGLFGGGNANAMGGAGYVANALNNDTGRELIMQGLNGNHEAVMNLSNILHTDVASVKSDLNTVSLALQNVGSQVGMSGLQVINAIQAGNASLASQLAQCCCENRLATCQQTNTLTTAITGANQRTVDAIADLKTTMVKEFCDAKERDMQDKINTQGDIITQLRNQADNAAQTNAFAAMLAPLANKITEIEGKIPNTVPVTWPNLTAVNTTPYVSGGYYGAGFGYNNGVTF